LTERLGRLADLAVGRVQVVGECGVAGRHIPSTLTGEIVLARSDEIFQPAVRANRGRLLVAFRSMPPRTAASSEAVHSTWSELGEGQRYVPRSSLLMLALRCPRSCGVTRTWSDRTAPDHGPPGSMAILPDGSWE
jgi:hypothetical protein